MVRCLRAVFGILLVYGCGAAGALRAEEPAPASQPQTSAPGLAQTLAPIQENLVKGMSQHFHLDEEQSRTAKDLLQHFVSALLEKHESEFTKLQMEVVTVRMTGKMPTAEQVQNWTERFTPIYEDFKAEFQKGNDALHDCLNDEQKKQHEADLAAMQPGFRGFEEKLAKWRKGEWKPEDWVPSSPEAQSTPSCEPERTWYFYTQGFIQDYELDAAQATSANSILKELLARAENMRASRASELKPLEEQIGALAAATPPDTAAIQKIVKQRDTLLKPISDLYEELKNRLDKLPREAQRAKYAKTKSYRNEGPHRAAATRPAN